MNYTKITFIGLCFLNFDLSIAFNEYILQRSYKVSQEVVDYIQCNFTRSQKDTYFAMLELSTFHDIYGFEGFLLKDMNGAYHMIDSKDEIGQGGSKKAVLLKDGRVLMLPNMDVDPYLNTAKWWPNCVDSEAAMITFLEKINVPALNRKKAFLIIPSKQNPGVSYELPVLISDSFDSYAKKKCFVIDMKSSASSTWNNRNYDTEADEFSIFRDSKEKLIIANWEPLLKPLIEDVVKLVINGVRTGTDARNLVVVKKERRDDQNRPIYNWQLRYFGFDFSGKYSNYCAPSSKKELKDLSSHERIQILNIVKYLAYDWIQTFVYYDEPLHNRNPNIVEAEDEYGQNSYGFSLAVAKYFTDDTYLMKILCSSDK